MPQSTKTIGTLSNIWTTKDSTDVLAVGRTVAGVYQDGQMARTVMLEGTLTPDESGNVDLTGVNLVNVNELTMAGLSDLKPYHLLQWVVPTNIEISIVQEFNFEFSDRFDYHGEYNPLYAEATTSGSRGITKSDSSGEIAFTVPRDGGYTLSVSAPLNITKVGLDSGDKIEYIVNLDWNPPTNSFYSSSTPQVMGLGIDAFIYCKNTQLSGSKDMGIKITIPAGTYYIEITSNR